MEEAEGFRLDREKALGQLEANMKPITSDVELDLEALYENNLISGTVNIEE